MQRPPPSARLCLALAALIGLAACAFGPQAQATRSIPVTPADTLLLQSAVLGHHARPLLGDLEQVRLFALPDGQRIGCGTWAAPDPYGNYGGRAPFYVRYSGTRTIRVHLDDLTGYGPARTGCSAAAARDIGAG